MPYPKRKMPYGFEEAAKSGVNARKLTKRFHCNYEQVNRWAKELGIEIVLKNPCRSVYMCDKNTHEDLKLFPSIGYAAEYINGDRRNISLCLNNHSKSAYGLWWRYADESP